MHSQAAAETWGMMLLISYAAMITFSLQWGTRCQPAAGPLATTLTGLYAAAAILPISQAHWQDAAETSCTMGQLSYAVMVALLESHYSQELKGPAVEV